MKRPLSLVTKVYGDAIYTEAGIIRTFVSSELLVGEGTEISPDIEIGLPDKPVERFVVGDGCRLYSGQIASRNFICGDFVTIHEGVWAYGRQSIVIGHNSWFGRRVTLDAEGGCWIGNGVGVGQDSHLWSHIRHGDTLVGNRWLRFGEFRAGDDAWFVGRCTSAPADHGDRSMAMVESNLTKSMGPDQIWGGNPARELTDKLGPPFEHVSVIDRLDEFHRRCEEFRSKFDPGPEFDFITASFDVVARTYDKTGTALERDFVRWLLPEAKFVPSGSERIEL